MASFPTLSSGTVMQYPAAQVTSQQVQVIRFLDGLDQRFLTRGKTYRRWRIQLDLLTDSEGAAVEAFFQQQTGSYTTFDFPDPFTGQLVPHCRFEAQALARTLTGLDANSCALWVIEGNE
jgi:hypothetical protein